MTDELSRHTVYEYLPEIRGIAAGIEIELAKQDLDHLTELYNIPAREQYGPHKMTYAMMLLGEWLKDTSFETRGGIFHKTNKEAQWKKMLAIINAKILDYHNAEPIIEITLSTTNQVARNVTGHIFTHDFDGELKPEILRLLAEYKDYTQTDALTNYLKSTTESVYKTINAINSILRKQLQLPLNKNLIDGKRKFGYRINPCYNIVLVK